MIVIAILLALSTASAAAVDAPVTLSASQASLLAADPQWVNLLHYRYSFPRGTRSQADGPEFFLSPDGKSNAAAELVATLASLQTPGAKSRCRFPARELFLTRHLPDLARHLPADSCEEWGRFRNHLPLTDVALVFSSFFVNNPSSAFGHTLLKFGHAVPGSTHHSELLDQGVNYAANATTNNALLYAMMGLFGGFEGRLSTVPYFYKVREYNDAESRDLWAYHLALTDEEKEMLRAHLWELGQTHFDYWYLSENCSYHMLSALDAAAPRLRLQDRQRSWVIPSDTVKLVHATPGLVQSTTYRASVATRFATNLARLTDEEQSIVRNLVGLNTSCDESTVTNLPDPRRALVLDAALDGLAFKSPADAIRTDTPEGRQSTVCIRQRARTSSAATPDPTPPAGAAPHDGHGSLRLAAGGGHSSVVGAFTEVGLRFAMHDMLDPPEGYPAGSQIEFLHGRIRVNLSEYERHEPFRKVIEPEELTLFRVASYAPVRFPRYPFSWRAEVGATRLFDQGCERCIAGAVEAGAGYTLGLGRGDELRATLLMDGGWQATPAFTGSPVRLFAGPRLSLLFRPLGRLAFRAEGFGRGLLFSHQHFAYGWRAGSRLQLGRSPFALDVSGALDNHERTATGSLMAYF